jgi:prevent-host-death family protein
MKNQNSETEELSNIPKFTVEEFQENFDNLMNRVENGESIIITSDHGNVVIVPYNEVVEVFQESGVSDELIRIHTDHEEGS